MPPQLPTKTIEIIFDPNLSAEEASAGFTPEQIGALAALLAVCEQQRRNYLPANDYHSDDGAITIHLSHSLARVGVRSERLYGDKKEHGAFTWRIVAETLGQGAYGIVKNTLNYKIMLSQHNSTITFSQQQHEKVIKMETKPATDGSLSHEGMLANLFNGGGRNARRIDQVHKERFILQRKAPGEELANIQKGSYEQELGIIVAMCVAVEKMHSLNYVHRDLKPENMFVQTDPQNPLATNVTLIDFGFAREINTAHRRSCTPLYAPPSNLTNTLTTTHHDVFSLIVMITERLTVETYAAFMEKKYPQSSATNDEEAGKILLTAIMNNLTHAKEFIATIPSTIPNAPAIQAFLTAAVDNQDATIGQLKDFFVAKQLALQQFNLTQQSVSKAKNTVAETRQTASCKGLSANLTAVDENLEVNKTSCRFFTPTTTYTPVSASLTKNVEDANQGKPPQNPPPAANKTPDLVAVRNAFRCNGFAI